MWYPATVTVPASAEPVSLDEVKKHLNLLHDDDDTLIAILIASARDHVEKYCNTYFAPQSVSVKCDAFSDFARLSVAPLTSVTSISYVDATGATQTLSNTVYDVRTDGLENSIVLKYGQSWPPIQTGSRITVVAICGDAVAPASVRHAILLFVADAFETRESAVVDGWHTTDSLLCNYRRGI